MTKLTTASSDPEKKETLAEKAGNTQLMTVEGMIERSVPRLVAMMEDASAGKRFAEIILKDIRLNPDLALCTPASLMGAIFQAAQMKIEPIAGMAYILPFNNSKKVGRDWVKVKEAQLILGYKGLISLFYRHSAATSLSWDVVHANDEFEFQKGSDAFLKHRRAMGDRGEKVSFWVGAKVNGDFLFEVMTKDEALNHGMDHSKTYNKKKGEFYKSSPWLTAFDSMAKKTLLIQLAKTLPMSVDLQKAILADESTKHITLEDLEGDVIDVVGSEDKTNWEEEAASE